jgi:hypothetical protein
LALYPILVLARTLLRIIIILRRKPTSSHPRPAFSITPAPMSTLIVAVKGASVSRDCCDVGLPALATHPSLRRRGHRCRGRFDVSFRSSMQTSTAAQANPIHGERMSHTTLNKTCTLEHTCGDHRLCTCRRRRCWFAGTCSTSIPLPSGLL